MYSLRSIETLVAIVEAGSITKAARRLGATQPAVSMTLRELEATLGVTLVDRSVRPLRPTHAGYAFYQRASSVVADVAALPSLVAGVAREKLATLRIGFVTPFGSALVRRLQQVAHEIHIRSGLTPDLVRALLARDLDLVVTSDPATLGGAMDRVGLVKEPFVAVLPRSTDTAGGIAGAARSLPFVRYTARSAISATIAGILRRHDLDPALRFEFDTSQTVLTTVANGIGWTITTPICIAQSQCDVAALEVLPLADELARRRLVILHRPDEFVPAALRLRELLRGHLVTMVRQAFGNELAWVAATVEDDDGGGGTT